MVLVDAGYLVALFAAKDALHDRAVAWSIACKQRLLITEYVAVKTINWFSRPKSRHRAAAFVRWLNSDRQCEFIPASRSLFDAGWRMFAARPDQPWSLTDCISFHLMNERGITDALAYDVHFEQAGFHPLLRRDPP